MDFDKLNKSNLISRDFSWLNFNYRVFEQVKNEKRLLSTNIQQEGDMFTCIALTNPSEVVLCFEDGEPLAVTRVQDKIGKEKPVLCVVPYDIS